jgi:ABC-type multidrug transport system ATPase subunit
MKQIMPSLSLQSISFRYCPPDPFVFRNVSLKISSGQNVLLLGENGSGKSTLGKLICGLLSATEGTVTINGQHVQKVDPKSRVRLAYYIPQDNQLQFMRSSLDQEIHLAQKLVGKQTVDSHIFTHHRMLSNPLTHPLDLSVNEGWRFSLLLSSIIRPSVLFVDEIPSWSNKNNNSLLIDLLGNRKSQNLITIFSFQRDIHITFDRTLLVGDETIHDK